MIKVLVSGGGNMGRTIVETLNAEPDLTPVGVVDALATGDAFPTPAGSPTLPLFADAAAAMVACSPDVVIDFTNAAYTPVLTEAALAHGVRPVIGTSGLSDAYVASLAAACEAKKLGGVLAANFAIGAVLLIHMAKIASPFFEAAEIIELHHDRKVDAPSGTSIATVQAMIAARNGRAFSRNEPQTQTIQGSRAAAANGVTIHSVRLPGLVAHQEVIFGGAGQTLTIRHDSHGRDSFMPGILLATREVMQRNHLVVGLDALIGL